MPAPDKKIKVDFCLLIPCYNNLPGLIGSLKSVSYSPNHFLVLVVDDGSKTSFSATDIKKELGETFPVIVLKNEKNLGITKTLNKGLEWINENADPSYIARLDCGDTCREDRFRLQVEKMNSSPGIGLTGSWCRFQNSQTGKGYVYRTPTEHSAIVKSMHSRNVFIHPTVMFRSDLVEKVGYYPLDFEYVEDYAYFWKMMEVTETFIFDQVLVVSEWNPGGISLKNRKKQLKARWRVVKEFASNQVLKMWGFLRLKLLLLLPNALALQIKMRKR